MHGKGVFRWPDKRLYKGEFKKGKRCGQGNMKYPDGREYSGKWLDGQ